METIINLGILLMLILILVTVVFGLTACMIVASRNERMIEEIESREIENRKRKQQ